MSLYLWTNYNLMPDNKKLTGRQDDAQIDIHDRNEVAYIKRQHGYTEGNLQVAMHVTGSTFRKKVIAWLDKNWKRISSK